MDNISATNLKLNGEISAIRAKWEKKRKKREDDMKDFETKQATLLEDKRFKEIEEKFIAKEEKAIERRHKKVAELFKPLDPEFFKKHASLRKSQIKELKDGKDNFERVFDMNRADAKEEFEDNLQILKDPSLKKGSRKYVKAFRFVQRYRRVKQKQNA